MSWTLDNYPPEMAALSPSVRAKAIEIANQLMERNDQDEQSAIKEAIKRAEEWEIDEQG